MKQKALFYLGRAVTAAPELFLSAITGYSTRIPIDSVMFFKYLNPWIGSLFITAGTATTLFCLTSTYLLLSSRLKLSADRARIEKKPEQFPLECVERISIADKQGLEGLLHSTKTQKEWGTMLKSHEEGKTCVVDVILDPAEAVRQGFIERTSFWRVKISDEKIAKAEYNGVHHYHPSVLGAASFNISHVDRGTPINWLNLLTFKINESPELIAYNKNHVYIPENASKQTLVRASPRDIVKYIQKYR